MRYFSAKGSNLDAPRVAYSMGLIDRAPRYGGGGENSNWMDAIRALHRKEKEGIQRDPALIEDELERGLGSRMVRGLELTRNTIDPDGTGFEGTGWGFNLLPQYVNQMTPELWALFKDGGIRDLDRSGVKQLESAGVKKLGSAGVKQLGSAGVKQLGSAGVKQLDPAEILKLRNSGVQI